MFPLAARPIYIPDRNSRLIFVMRHRAHAVDLHGFSHADYEFECATDEEAKDRATSYLMRIPSSKSGKAFVALRVLPVLMTARPGAETFSPRGYPLRSSSQDGLGFSP